MKSYRLQIKRKIEDGPFKRVATVISPLIAGDSILKTTSGNIGSAASPWDNVYGTKVTSISEATEANECIRLDQAQSMLKGLNWQTAVESIFDPTAGTPLAPSEGDRYISSATANGWTDNYIYEWNGSSWSETVVTEGFACWVLDEDVNYVFTTSWVLFGTTVSHNNTTGLNTGNYIHLTSAEYTVATQAATTSLNGFLSSTDWTTFNNKQAALTFGIANTNSVIIDSADVTDGEYAKFTASGLESKTFAEVKNDLSLENVTNESKSTMFTSPTFTGTVSGVTATMVGLGNVTNESKSTMFTNSALTGNTSIAAIVNTGSLPITIGITAGHKFSINTDGFVFDGNTGKIGMGISNPSQLLDINGTTDNQRIQISEDGDERAQLGLSNGNGGFLSLTDDFDSENIVLRSYGDCFFNSGGNLSIGIASPATKLDINGAITQHELSIDPDDPIEGANVVWQSDGTGSGDDGDIMMKITAGSTTKTVTLVDFSAA